MPVIEIITIVFAAITIYLCYDEYKKGKMNLRNFKIVLFSAHRPFKDLEAADITSASVRLSPPDTTIQIVETEELVSYLNEVVIYNKDNSYTEYAGQAVIFTLSLADGSQVEIIAYNPFIIIDGIGYKCKYEPCEALNHYANELMTREP